MEIPETVSKDTPLKRVKAAFALKGFSTKLINPNVAPDNANETTNNIGKTIINNTSFIREDVNI